MHHPAELTFYDELGVAPDASPEEIRQSFRALVRIVHPDHHPDEQLKDIAERQMRKLNRVYSVLSDPDKRRRYDQVLEGKNFGPTIVLGPNSSVKVRRLMGRLAWVGAFLAILSTLLWLSTENPVVHSSPYSEHTAQPALVPAPGVVAVSTDEVAQLRAELHSLRAERDLAVKELLRLRGAPSRAFSTASAESYSSSPPAPATALTELPSVASPASSPPSFAPLRTQPLRFSSASRVFAGFWFYARSDMARGKSSLYPPEFIEATISEQGGVVRGKYRSRYKIVDRAISPDVIFEFSGNAAGTTMIAPWNGPGGAKGEITLKIAGENALKVDWTTTELGSIQGLISGTATLTRRLD